jgi:Domain of unknown function (DUF5753)/Helix-turn-helix domain
MAMTDGGAVETIEDRKLSQLMVQALAVRTEVHSRDFSAASNQERFYGWLMEQTTESHQEAVVSEELRAMGGVARAASTSVRSSARSVLTAAVGGAGIGAGSFALRTSLVACPTPSNPRQEGATVQRLVLGGHLRRLREEAGITTERAALSIRGSHWKISRTEHGRVGFKERDVADLLTLYGVGPGAEREALLTLARGAKTPGWWQSYTELPLYFGLEAAAASIREYELQFVPGLLQVEEYARAVIRLGTSTAEAKLAQLVKARMSRQEILARENPPRLWAVLDESALCRIVGGTAVMRAQLRHLIEMCDHPAVTLQILPFSAGAHRAMGGPFTILRYTEADRRDVVFMEQLTTALYLDKQTEVDAYLEVIEEVCLQSRPSAETPGILKAVLDRL